MANYSYNYYIWCVYVGVIMLKSLKSIKNYIFNYMKSDKYVNIV